MRANLSLKASLAGAFGLLAVIAAGQGTLSIVKLAGIRHSITEVATRWLPSATTVSRMRGAASKVRIKQLRLLALSDDRGHLAENEAQLALMHDKFAEARKAFGATVSSHEERALYESFSSLCDRFERAGAEMRRLMQAGQTGLALHHEA